MSHLQRATLSEWRGPTGPSCQKNSHNTSSAYSVTSALLGSAATTIGDFGVLVFAVLPPLQQFGIITALTIVYAFVASMIVLPTLLVFWTRYVGPDTAESDAVAQSSVVAGKD